MLSPAPAEPPKSFALGKSLRRGQLWEDSPGGTAGVTPTSWWRWDVAQGWQRLCVVPRPQRRAGGLASPPPPPAPGIRGASGSSETCRGVKDGGTYGCEGPGGHEPARLPSQVGKPGTWRGGRSPSSLVPALHRHLGAELCRSGPEQGWHRERTNPPVPGTAEPGTPPPTPGLAASAAEQGLVRCRMGARELPAPPRLCSPESAGAEPGKMLGRAGSQEGAFEDFSVLSSTGWAQPAPCP